MISFSVVVNTHNRAVLLADTLRGLAGLRYGRFEVVVVNGPSTDGTAAVLEEWAGRIKRVDCPEANLARSRNLGIEAAAGEVIAFIDDDAVPHPNWLMELSYAYADPRVGGAGGFTLDHTGVAFQARKNVCDRFGNAFDRPDDYDERVLNVAGSALYPSLLGTNSSFRAAALRSVGGFDPVFAYFLDETDLCLRLIDAGWRVGYASEALVFHQFAPSAMRDARRVPRSIYRLVVSETYFILRHGARASLEEAGRQLAAYEAKMRADNARLYADKAIDLGHRVTLDEDLRRGLEDGRASAFAGGVAEWLTKEAWCVEFKQFSSVLNPCLAVLARSPTPWLDELLEFLAVRGWIIHLLLEDNVASSCFQDKIWRHRIALEAGAGEVLAGARDIPFAAADWCVTVGRRYRELKDFGFDLVASTLRELPGLVVLDEIGVLLRDGSTAEELDAHPEWRERPLFAHFHCGKLIKQEERAVGLIAAQAGPEDSFEAVLSLLARQGGG